MQYLGGKLSAAQLQVTSWVGSVRRSLQGALELVWGDAEEKKDDVENKNAEEEEEEEEGGGEGGGRFLRAMTPLRSFARRSRRSLRRFSMRNRQSVQRRASETCSAQVNNYCTSDEDKDTDTLIENEPELQSEACEPTSEVDGPLIPEDVDTTDFYREVELAPFPESSAPLLDTSAQKSKADLGKRRSRSRPSRSLRAGVAQGASPDWRTCDTSEGSSKHTEPDSEDEEPKEKVVCPPPTSQRVSVFPGMNPSALIAQIKRRTSGGVSRKGEEAEEEKGREEKESPSEEASPSPPQKVRSPRSPAHLAGAARVLPPIGGTDGSAASCPAWLKELRSKKRLSQHDSEA